jgi:positive regulator of sigma E activity
MKSRIYNNLIKVILLLFILSSDLLAQGIKSKELYLEYSSFPKRVFTGQKFDVTLKAMILKPQDSYDKVITTFSAEDNINVLTKDINWTLDKSNKYEATVTYKIYDKQFTLPRITIALVKDEEVIDFISVKSPDIKYEKIAVGQKLFSNIIASKLEVNTVKTKQYTNNILHSTIHISASNSNLEDTKLGDYQEQKIESLEESYPEQNLYYSVMVPIHTKQLSFTYYNTKLQDFVKIQIPMILDDELVSTQTELNPYNSSILVYKQMLAGAFLGFFILLYIFTRGSVHLFFITVLIAILAYLFIPNKKIIVNKNVKVYILPTINSTVYETLESKKLVEIINDKGNFVKVLFENQNIGWIKKNDIE